MMVRLNNQTHQRGRLLSSSWMPSASWSSSRGSLGSFMGFLRVGGLDVVLQRERLHPLEERFPQPARPQDGGAKDENEQADRDRAVGPDASEVLHELLDHGVVRSEEHTS